MMAEDLSDALEFAPEPAEAETSTQSAWRILVVDDDEDVHQATRFVLQNQIILDRPVATLHAHSAQEARSMLATEQDLAVILLDVVMESADAGLKLVEEIRERYMLDECRIILRTGQPGYAPELRVIRDYDINDYKTKSELTHLRLITSLTAAIRSYQQLHIINASRKGLDLIVQNAPLLFSRQSVASFGEGVLIQVAALLGLPTEGLICLRPHATAGMEQTEWRIIGSGGSLRDLLNQPLAALPDPAVRKVLDAAIHSRCSQYQSNATALYIRDHDGQEAVVYLATQRTLDEIDRQLLELFCTNIAIGFQNVLLLEQLNQKAFFDTLSNLPNRHMFTTLLHEIVVEKPRNWVTGMIDIQRFSEINDALGHGTGDILLQKVSLRLRSLLPATVVVARVGVDQFGFSGRQREIDIDHLLAELTLPYWVDNKLLRIRVSAGFSRLSEAGDSGRDCLKNTTLALNLAKNDCSKPYIWYQPSMTAASRQRLDLLSRLYQALEANQLQLYYQPQFDLQRQVPIGVEALLRWPLPEGGFISPVEFIPLAESSGIIIELGEWVINEALRQSRVWRDSGLPALRLAINISMAQFQHPGLPQLLTDAAAKHHMQPGEIELEITESVAMQNGEQLKASLARFKALGYSIAIDDFGTGFSSLAYLRELAVDRIKIDRSFIMQLNQSDAKASIAQMIVQLGHSLDLAVIAEGVETQEQCAMLADMGCDEVQGFLLGKPMPGDTLRQWWQPFLDQAAPRA